MSWDDVVIGSGLRGNSAMVCFDIGKCEKHGISENNSSYWISNCVLGLGCTIFKNTKEGKKITKMREEGKSLHQIQAFIDAIIMKKIKIEKIYRKIEELKRNSFREGKEKNQEEIRTALGLVEPCYGTTETDV